MHYHPATPEAYQLMHEGAIALAEVESAGMCVDVDYLHRAIKLIERKTARLEEDLAQSEVGKVWTKTYGRSANFQSTEQLGVVLFDKMGFEASGKTEKGRLKTDVGALATIDHPFVKDYLEIKKLKKASGTYLRGILTEVVDGKLHCFFNLHTVLTYRSSASDINFQNIPVREASVAKLVRTAFVPRPGRQLVEVDIAGAEVGVAACYHKDPQMLKYLSDKTLDLHRDVAMECYMLPKEEITKNIRNCGKGQFVFAQFYGDWFKECAKNLWASVDRLSLTTASGKSVREHLTAQGITSLGSCHAEKESVPGTFEYHIQKIEEYFWKKRFPVYAAWKKKWYDTYLRQGWVQMLTGFVCRGFMKRNEVINYPVQGSAFHCLLWSLIRLVRVELKKRNMKTLIIGQIHDSMVADVVPSELEEFVALCKMVMTVMLARQWKWLIVPIEIEFEVAPVGATWFDKEKYKLAV